MGPSRGARQWGIPQRQAPVEGTAIQVGALSIGALATALVMLLMASGAGTASAQEEGATATTTAATNITATEATLNGTVNANGYTVSGCQFLHGPTTEYGSDVACTTLPGQGRPMCPLWCRACRRGRRIISS